MACPQFSSKTKSFKAGKFNTDRSHYASSDSHSCTCTSMYTFHHMEAHTSTTGCRLQNVRMQNDFITTRSRFPVCTHLVHMRAHTWICVRRPEVNIGSSSIALTVQHKPLGFSCPPPQCWDCRPTPSHSAFYVDWGKGRRSSHTASVSPTEPPHHPLSFLFNFCLLHCHLPRLETFRNSQSVHCCNFVISRQPTKQNHTVCQVWGPACC